MQAGTMNEPLVRIDCMVFLSQCSLSKFIVIPKRATLSRLRRGRGPQPYPEKHAQPLLAVLQMPPSKSKVTFAHLIPVLQKHPFISPASSFFRPNQEREVTIAAVLDDPFTAHSTVSSLSENVE